MEKCSSPKIAVRSFAFVCLMSSFACGSAPRKLDVKSEPAGAEVVNRAGEKIGQTPFTLEGDVLSKAEQDGIAYLTFQLPGYDDKTILLEAKAEMTAEVKLSKQEADFYRTKTLRDFTPETNAMTRELLRIQGLLLMKKVDEAEKALTDFNKQYSYVAASYVMMANVSILKGDRTGARNSLLRAKTIDPLDPVVARMLKSLGGAGP